VSPQRTQLPGPSVQRLGLVRPAHRGPHVRQRDLRVRPAVVRVALRHLRGRTQLARLEQQLDEVRRRMWLAGVRRPPQQRDHLVEPPLAVEQDREVVRRRQLALVQGEPERRLCPVHLPDLGERDAEPPGELHVPGPDEPTQVVRRGEPVTPVQVGAGQQVVRAGLAGRERVQQDLHGLVRPSGVE
jgi:hypothetical protein